MTLNKEIEFNKIVNDILKHEEFIALKYEVHHGITRLDHSLHVAKLTYLVCDFFHLKRTYETTRAALLHDFFKDNEVEGIQFINHPLVAAKKAQNYFSLDNFSENIIASHMFPTSKVWPKYKESFLVSSLDKVAAVKEMACYKVPLSIGATFLFFLNFFIIQR